MASSKTSSKKSTKKIGSGSNDTSSKRLDEAIRLLERAHRKGRELKRDYPRYHSRKASLDSPEWWEEAGLTNGNTARKYKQFAETYSKDDLEELIGLCRKHDRPLGVSFVFVFVTIPKRTRRSFQRKVVANGWSYARTRREALKLFGRRRTGGRRPKVAKDADGLLVQLDQKCDAWERWCKEFERIGDLPSDAIKRQVRRLRKETRKLHELVRAEQAVRAEDAST